MAKEENKTIIAYKGFDQDLKCRGFQYEVGKEYEMDGDIVCCQHGFHACESPLEVLDHYFLLDDANMARFCEVEQSGRFDKENDNSTKVASSKIKIKAELKFADLINLGIEWIKEKTKPEIIKNGDLSDTDDRTLYTINLYTGKKIAQNNTVNFNYNPFNTKLKDIFISNEINGKFTNYDKSYNESVINEIYKENIQELINILEMTFLDVFKIFRDVNEKEKLVGFEKFDTVIKELKSKEKDDYIAKLEKDIMEFENFYLKHRAKK